MDELFVLCINDGIVDCDCGTGAVHTNAHSKVRKGAIYEVITEADAKNLDMMCALTGCRCTAFVLASGELALAKRFVKLDEMTPEEHASEIKMLADEQLLELIMPGKDHPHA